MKRYILNLFLLVMLFSVSACSDDDLGPSIFDPSTEELTELDLWMQANFTKPYNIEVLYKWLDIESDMAATLVPPILPRTHHRHPYKLPATTHSPTTINILTSS